jgi:hypothetical protein
MPSFERERLVSVTAAPPGLVAGYAVERDELWTEPVVAIAIKESWLSTSLSSYPYNPDFDEDWQSEVVCLCTTSDGTSLLEQPSGDNFVGVFHLIDLTHDRRHDILKDFWGEPKPDA